MQKAAAPFSGRPVVLGPMAGITEAPFRGICKRMGASLTYTEMVSAKGLHYNPDAVNTQRLLTFDESEVPCAVQLFGSEPELMARQAAYLAERYENSVCAIDINMGCPVAKVVAKGEGSALMRDPRAAADIVTAVSRAVMLPVTAKFRKGWDDSEGDAVGFARVLEEAGASAITVHGRTRQQFYQGQADWEVIAAVKSAVTIPVTGSGDVFTPSDVVRMFEETGVDAVMVARGARGNPWVFGRARALLDTGIDPGGPSPVARVDMAREHARALVEFAGERAFVRMRKHVAWYIAGMPHAVSVRVAVNECRSHAELDAVLAEYRERLESE